MTHSFNPYTYWLEIPVEEQPPHFYRLLGLPVYANDREEIARAADSKMEFVRSCQLGRYGEHSQTLLNHLAKARVCLLDPAQKAAYDAALARYLFAGAQASATPPPVDVFPMIEGMDAFPAAGPVEAVPIHFAATAVAPQPPALVQAVSAMPSPPMHLSAPVEAAAANAIGVREEPEDRRRSRRRSKRPSGIVEFLKIVGGGALGLVIAYPLICWLMPQSDLLNLFHPPSPETEARGTNAIAANSDRERKPADKTEPARPHVAAPNSNASGQAANSTAPPGDNRPAVNAGGGTTAAPEASPNGAAEPTEAVSGTLVVDRRKRLEAARDSALAGGAIDQALRAVAELALLDGQDALAAQFEALRAWQEEYTGNAAKAILELRVALLEQAVDSNLADEAKRHANDILAAARRLDDADLVRRATLCAVKLQSM